MKLTPKKINIFLFFKLPAAYFCGVRLKCIEAYECTTTVKHRWINQNPFGSMYFAVQAMAAELTTGALVLSHIKESGKNISMLVSNQKGTYSKKALGKITFSCADGKKVLHALEESIRSGEGITFWMTSVGIDEVGDEVSRMEFEWRIKVKS
ncbi:MAG: thioesterase [Bacteroidetes bacterium HGW-Bacteroidetes-2]|nr:MAG: thioesterase [Bacteroidetes bacterium HGW-Bacteroidetes-2]